MNSVQVFLKVTHLYIISIMVNIHYICYTEAISVEISSNFDLPHNNVLYILHYVTNNYTL